MSSLKNKRPLSNYLQQGGTMWSLLFNCALVVFFLYIGAKLVPVYNASSVVQAALENSVNELPTPGAFNERKFAKSFQKRLYIDGVTGPDLNKTMQVDKTKDSLKVTIAYVEKVPLFYNIGIYLDFVAIAEK